MSFFSKFSRSSEPTRLGVGRSEPSAGTLNRPAPAVAPADAQPAAPAVVPVPPQAAAPVAPQPAAPAVVPAVPQAAAPVVPQPAAPAVVPVPPQAAAPVAPQPADPAVVPGKSPAAQVDAPPAASPAAGTADVHAPRQVQVCTGKLEELEFSDLMLWPDGRGFLRHTVGYVGPIIEVPEAYRADVRAVLAEIDSEERGREFFLRHGGVPYRVARIDTIDGPGYFMRRPKFPVPQLDSLGLPQAMVDTLRALGKTSGMLLIAGATGSGKSTTIYSYLTELVARHGDIAVAVEDPPEIPAQGIYGERGQGLWYQVDAHKVGGFEAAMIAAMRYNPRYIMLGEIRAPKVANEAIRAAVNGHLVLATIHGSSLPGAILALQQIAAAGAGSLDLARSILADGLAAVMHQELVPDPDKPGRRLLQAEMLCFGKDLGLRAKIRSGKLEQLSTEIDAQRLRLQRGQLPTEI